jgi:hypothetical protein
MARGPLSRPFEYERTLTSRYPHPPRYTRTAEPEEGPEPPLALDASKVGDPDVEDYGPPRGNASGSRIATATIPHPSAPAPATRDESSHKGGPEPRAEPPNPNIPEDENDNLICGSEAGSRKAAEKTPRPAIPTAIPLEEAGTSESCVFVIPREEGARRALAEALEERRGVNNLAGSHEALAWAARALAAAPGKGMGAVTIATHMPPSSANPDQLEGTVFREVYARACSVALGVPVDRRDPMVRMLMSGRALTICAPFAGPKRDGDIEDWARNLGGAAACYDVQRDATHGDLTSGRVCGAIMAAARAGWFTKIIMAMPCQSFTCMKLVPVPIGEPPAPPMRLRSMLPGVPECPEGWEPYFAKHERFISWGWDVASAVLEWEGGGLIAEHPVDRGDEQKPRFYREKFAEHAPLSLHPKTLEAVERFGVKEMDIVQCMSRCPHEKGTTLFADATTWRALKAAALPCLHETHDQCAGTNSEGNSVSQLSSYWSSEMNRWIVLAAIGGSYAAVRSAALDAAEPAIIAAGLRKEALRGWEYRPIGSIKSKTPLAELGLLGVSGEGIT